MEKKAYLIVGALLIAIGVATVTVIFFNMGDDEEQITAEGQTGEKEEDAAPFDKIVVPVKDPAALEHMKWDWGQAVSSSLCSKFFRIWGYLEKAKLTKTNEKGKNKF